jgi:hypothetical protein
VYDNPSRIHRRKQHTIWFRAEQKLGLQKTVRREIMDSPDEGSEGAIGKPTQGAEFMATWIVTCRVSLANL